MENKHAIFRKGKKVILRPAIESDIPHFQRWMNDQEVTQYLRTYLPVSLEQERDWYEKITRPDPGSITLIIVDAKKNVPIGTIGFAKINYRDQTATTGTSIGNQSYWGKGYGTEAKMILLEYAFSELNLRKIYSEVIAYNARSLAYAKKCGYVEEARIPQHYYRKGQCWDKVILAVYREPWEKLWKKTAKKFL